LTIKLVLLDIDGVLTDGKVSVDSNGNESKTIDFKDIDAVFEMKRRGYKVGLITGEATPITLFFNARFKPDFFYMGVPDNLNRHPVKTQNKLLFPVTRTKSHITKLRTVIGLKRP